jgi:putative peptide zinc metalloprotease protein
LPGRHREPSALTGRARLLVTLWVLIIVPILISLMLGAVLLLPKLLTSAWDSGRRMLVGLPHLMATADVVGVLASLLHLLALVLPVLGSVLITQRILRTTVAKVRQWSNGRPTRRRAVLVLAGVVLAGAAWAWWPSGQYQPVRADEVGTLTSMVRPLATPTVPPVAALAPGSHLAASMIPVGGATKRDPALFVIAGAPGHPATAIVATSTPADGKNSTKSGRPMSIVGTGFPFAITSGDAKTSASATGTANGGATYNVAYSLVTVSNGNPVTATNSASAVGHCVDCTTVAVSFQVVLIVGQSNVIAPTNEATALNSNCPACTTTAIADQMVVTLKAQPPVALKYKLDRILSQLNLLPLLGTSGTPAAVAATVNSVQQQVQTVLDNAGLLTTPSGSTATTTPVVSSSGTSPSGAAAGSSSSSAPMTTTTSLAPSSTTTTTTLPSTTTTITPSG